MSDAPTFLALMATAKAWFAGRSWDAWRAVLAVLSGLPLAEAQLELFRACTGRTRAPVSAAREAWLIIGWRGGKSLIAAFVAVVLACYRTYVLAPGERGVVMISAADRRQARVIFRYVLGFIEGLPGLKALIVRKTVEAIHLTNGISIEIHAASFRAVRGYTIVAYIGDEISFWRDETSANPDVEVLHAVRPAMATVPGALLLCISSPFARRGALWQAYRDHWGKDDDPVLVWKAPSWVMNPSIERRIIEEAFAQDEAAASAEWGAEFRTDIERFVSHEAVAACTVAERRELLPAESNEYHAFTDPAGGSGADSFTLAIAHSEERDERMVAVLDLVREQKPPFSPATVVQEFAEVLRAYGVAGVVGDRYAGAWPAEQFAKHGIEYEACPEPKSDIYRDLLPLLNSGAVELLDHPKLLAQLTRLERRTARGGKDSIDHGPHGHDDLVNSAVGALLMAADAGAYTEPARLW